MLVKRRFPTVFSLAIVIAILVGGCAATIPPAGMSSSRLDPLPACSDPVQPPLSVIHFFDWYATDQINGPSWTHKIDWSQYGLRNEEVGSSKAYYDSQFKLIKELGVDGIMYQYYQEQDMERTWPRLSPNFMASLLESRTKIGLFYDWEIQQAGGVPLLTEKGYIQPTTEAAQHVIDGVLDFYERVPRDLWLLDRQGRLPIMVFGFDFDRTNTNFDAWYNFYRTMLQDVERQLGVKPVFYWTGINAVQQELAFQYFPDQIRPFNFVLDNPQMQLAPGNVTWNINFDNLGVQRAHGLRRVIRDDPRYLQEMLWLAKYTAPDLLFIYSWNEYYEGANIMPDQTYGTSRYEFMQALLRDVKQNSKQVLPCTLLIVDNLAQVWKNDDWHLKIEEQMTLYPLRRLAPQADVRMAEEVTPDLLERYDLIIMLAQLAPDKIEQLAPLMDRKRVVIIGPQAAYIEPVRNRFVSKIERVVRNKEVPLIDNNGERLGDLFVRDDVFKVLPQRGTATVLGIEDDTITPVLLRQGDDWWMNAYVADDRVLAPLFEQVYGRSLEPGVMHGEGMRAQLLEVQPDGTLIQQTFSAPAVFEHLPLPVPWNPPPPPELPPVTPTP